MPTPIEIQGDTLDNSDRGTGVPACGPSKTDPNQGLLRLLQLADSALPIGSTAHSFGLEALVDDGSLTVDGLYAFLRDYLAETGTQEARYCRQAFALAVDFHVDAWLTLNDRLSALKPARESRAASATLGRRFLQLVAGLSDATAETANVGTRWRAHGRPVDCDNVLDVPGTSCAASATAAVEASRTAGSEIHHCAAFGLAAGCLGFYEDASVAAFLQQGVYTMISAAQRLLPFGQHAATRMLWDLHASIEEAATQSRVEEVFCSTPLIDIASMRHPRQITRLFIS